MQLIKLLGHQCFYLSEVLKDVRFKGYYITLDDMTVISTKGSSPKKLTGSKNRSGHYYSFTINGYSETIRADRLRDMLRKFATDNSKTEAADTVTLVAKPTVTNLSFGIVRLGMQGVMNVRFSTLEDAKKAAEAYAKANRGTEFTVVEFKGTVVADGVTWK